jgi:hypothetical protein
MIGENAVMKFIKVTGFPVLLACMTLHSSPLLAQPANPRAPERVRTSAIDANLSSKTPVATNKGQDEAIAYFTALGETIKSLSRGNDARAPVMTPAVTNFMGAAYLFCSINEGVCKFMLEAMLEADIIAGRQNKNDQCPTLTGFWKTYLGNDLENRHKYNTRTAYLSSTVEFNQKERPKYVKCQSSVRSETTGSTTDREYFMLRYRNRTDVISTVNKVVATLEVLKAKVPNVWSAIGATKAN